jgi:hypothetical protein
VRTESISVNPQVATQDMLKIFSMANLGASLVPSTLREGHSWTSDVQHLEWTLCQ